MSINEERTEQERLVIEDCIKLIKNSKIENNEKQSLNSSLENLKIISSRKKLKINK